MTNEAPRGRALAAAMGAALSLTELGCSAPPARAPLEDTSGSNATDSRALAELDEGERTVAVAAGDCASACGGVAQMVRARVKLCAPATSACSDAERREADARRKVAAFCDPCVPTP